MTARTTDNYLNGTTNKTNEDSGLDDSGSISERVLSRIFLGLVAALFVHCPEALIFAAFVVTLETIFERVFVRLAFDVSAWFRRLWYLRRLEIAPGYNFAIGHTKPLFEAVGKYPCTWDLFAKWSVAAQPRPVRVQIFTRHCVVIADPVSIKRVFNTNIKNYGKDTEFAYNPFLDILGTGLVTSEGESWRRQRQRISQALRMEILDDVVDISTRAVNRLSEKLEKIRGTGKEIELAEEFRLLTLQVIGEAILSLSPEESDEVMPELYLPIMEECNRRSLEPWRTFLPTKAFFEHKSRVKKLNAYITKLIRKRWKTKHSATAVPNENDSIDNPHADILDRVLADVPKSEYGPEVERQMCDEIKTFLLAGHETSAAMLIWTMWELTKSPEKMKIATDEAKRVYKNFSSSSSSPSSPLSKKQTTTATTTKEEKEGRDHPSRDELNQLEYIVGALKESLRLYSVVPVVTRKCLGDDYLGGDFIPKGTTVIISVQGVHHREDLWKNAQYFEPKRFVGNETDETGNYSYLPFIQGPRNCLGQYLALLEARVVMANLLRKFTFKSSRESNGAKHTKMIPIAPNDGMWFTVS
jgi:beta-ring hydroxylase